MHTNSDQGTQHTISLPPDDPTRSLTLTLPEGKNLPHIGLVGDTYTILLAGKDTAERSASSTCTFRPAEAHHLIDMTSKRPSSSSRARSKPPSEEHSPPSSPAKPSTSPPTRPTSFTTQATVRLAFYASALPLVRRNSSPRLAFPSQPAQPHPQN
jgi:hypothetical protein